MLDQLDCAPYMEYKALREANLITGIEIVFVDLPKIVEEIYPKIDPKNNLRDPIIHQQFNILSDEQKLVLATQMLITRYCIHRILTFHKLWSQDVWMYKTSRDYYGDEVQNICLKPAVCHQVEPLLETLRGKSPSEKIEQVLLMEYGHLIPSVTNKKWFVKNIHTKDLEYSNTEHYLQCRHDVEQNETSGQYRKAIGADFPYPRGVTILTGHNTYKVIDGYHRLVGTPANESALVIYCLRD